MAMSRFEVAAARSVRHVASVTLATLAAVMLSPAVSLTQSTESRGPELVLQTGHTGAVDAIALGPDGRFLVSGSQDHSIKLWDLATGNVLRTLDGHALPVRGVIVSGDGRWIASGSDDRSVRVWDVKTGESRIFGLHDGPVMKLAFSRDGRRLTSIGPSDLKVWDVASGRERRSTSLLSEKQPLVAAAANDLVVALTSDGRLAALTGGLDYRTGVLGIGSGLRASPIRIIDAESGRDLQNVKLQGDVPRATDLAFSPDGKLLAFRAAIAALRQPAAMQSVIGIVDVATGRQVKELQDHGSLNHGIGFTPDGSMLAVRGDGLAGLAALQRTQRRQAEPGSQEEHGPSRSGSITLFDVATWRAQRELENTGNEGPSDVLRPPPIVFSGDGRLVATSAGPSITVMATSSGRRIRSLRTILRESAVSASSVSAWRAWLKPHGVELDDLQDAIGTTRSTRADHAAAEELLSKLDFTSEVTFSPDGKRLSLLSFPEWVTWDTVAGMPLPRAVSAGGPRLGSDHGTVFSPDGKLSAETTVTVKDGGAESVIVVKEVAGGREVTTIGVGSSTMTMGRTVIKSPVSVSQLAFGPQGLTASYCETSGSSPDPRELAAIDPTNRRALGRMMKKLGDTRVECRLKTFDPMTGRVLQDRRLKDDRRGGESEHAVLSPAGRLLMSFELGTPKHRGRSGSREWTRPYTLVATDAGSRRKRWEIKGESLSDASPAVTLTADEAVIAVATLERGRSAIKVYESSTGRGVRSVEVGAVPIRRIRLSRDASILAVVHGSREPRSGSQPGTSNQLRVSLFETVGGRRRATLVHESLVEEAAFSPDGRLVVTLCRDGNLYVWDAQSGAKLATILHIGGPSYASPEWLVVTPDGLFDGSPMAWQQLMWRFSNDTFDVGPVEGFFNDLYYPGLAAELFAGRRPKAPRDVRKLDRRTPGVSVSVSADSGSAVSARQVLVRIEVMQAPADATHAQASGAQDVRLFRNGTLVRRWAGDVLSGQPNATLEVTVPVVAGVNRFAAYAFNRDNVKSPDAATEVTGAESLRRKGTAYVLVIGVDAYENVQYNLKYAVADATAFGAELAEQQMRMERFDRIELVKLLDRDATKANVLFALRRLAGNDPLPAGAPRDLERLAQAQPEDAVIIYFAGHGTTRGARFYLVPHDLGYSGSRAGVDAQAIETILRHSVSDLELESAVSGLDAAELVLVVDACNSGQALESDEKRRGPMNSKGLAQLAYEKGMYILTAAQSYQAALETARLGHGYLTFALVEEGLKQGLADAGQQDGRVSVREWFDYAVSRVPEMQQTGDSTRLLLQQDEKLSESNPVRHMQTPRAFYRRDPETFPVVIGTVGR